MSSGKLVIIVLTSVISTVLVLGGSALVWQEQVVSYLQSQVVSPVVTEATSSLPLPSRSDSQVIPEIVAAADPAVVSVVVTKDVPVYERYYEQLDPWGFFGGFNVPRVREQGTEEREVGGGSGFIVSRDGLIVTNRHVVADTEARYSVLLNDGRSYEATVVARDPQLDIAVLAMDELPEESLTALTFGASEALQLGETVIAIGNALAEFRNSVSVGVVSGLSRSIVARDAMGRSEQLDQVIQTDAAINPGNSGGPLLNLDGEVIGVNVATSRGAENISFALPAHVVAAVVESVQEHGEIVRPFLGVRYLMLNPEIAARNDLSVEYGALVQRGETAAALAVIPGSPADRAGITENTIILAVDGEELTNRSLASVLREKRVGETITLRLLQDGEERTVTVTLDADG